jgi:hypothetical protein
MPSKHASSLVVLLPVLLKYHVQGHIKPSAMKGQQIHNQEDLKKICSHIFHTLNTYFNTGKPMDSVHSLMRQLDPVISAWSAEHFDNIYLC